MSPSSGSQARKASRDSHWHSPLARSSAVGQQEQPLGVVPGGPCVLIRGSVWESENSLYSAHSGHLGFCCTWSGNPALAQQSMEATGANLLLSVFEKDLSKDHDHMCSKSFLRKSWSWSSSFPFQKQIFRGPWPYVPEGSLEGILVMVIVFLFPRLVTEAEEGPEKPCPVVRHVNYQSVLEGQSTAFRSRRMNILSGLNRVIRMRWGYGLESHEAKARRNTPKNLAFRGSKMHPAQQAHLAKLVQYRFVSEILWQNDLQYLLSACFPLGVPCHEVRRMKLGWAACCPDFDDGFVKEVSVCHCLWSKVAAYSLSSLVRVKMMATVIC